MSSSDETLVFIDLSYYIFHRFFATQRWIKLSKQEFGSQEEEKALMIEKFSKMFEDNIKTLKSKHKCQWKNIYLVKDCSRDSIWRMSYYPDYKKTRDDHSTSGTKGAFDPIVFTKAYNIIIPNMISKYGINLVGYENAEADDVIAIFHDIVRRRNPTQRIVIITNDNDYVQLYDEYTLIQNCNKVEIAKKLPKDIMDVFLEWKIIKGDVSDNIPPINMRIGDKKALKLAQNKDLLAKKLKEDPIAKGQYELNKILIDFRYIPDAIKLGVKNLKVI